MQKRRSRGVTLVEVMNFATLACILGGVSVVGMARYVRHAKTAEAVNSVTAIATGAARAFDASDASEPSTSNPHASRRFPRASKQSVPADRSDVSGSLYRSAAYEWEALPWRDLGFRLTQPQAYAYAFESVGVGTEAKATAIAEGDLDGDADFSQFRLAIGVDESRNAKVATTLEIEASDE